MFHRCRVAVSPRLQISDHLIFAHRKHYIGPSGCSDPPVSLFLLVAVSFGRIIRYHSILVKILLFDSFDDDKNGDPLSDEASFRSNLVRKCLLARKTNQINRHSFQDDIEDDGRRCR